MAKLIPSWCAKARCFAKCRAVRFFFICRSAVVWVSLALIGVLDARADFVDELPELPTTPSPRATESPADGDQPPKPGSKNKGLEQDTLLKEQEDSPKEQGVSPKEQGVSPKERSDEQREQGSSSKEQSSKKGISGTGASGSKKVEKTPPDSSDGGLFSSQIIEHNRSAPISTQGDVLQGSLAKGKLRLSGNVEILQDDTLMKSDLADIFSKPGTTAPERALAKGKVSLLKKPNARVPEIRAIADEIEYFIAERRVVLRGKPKIWRGIEQLQGEVIEVALDTGDIRIQAARSILDPNKMPSDNKKNESKKKPKKAEKGNAPPPLGETKE